MYTTDAIVLKKYDAGEADGLFVLYTKDFGKMRAFAQGVKKEGAKLKGHLEPLNLASVQFVLGRGGERLTHAEAQECWAVLRGNYDLAGAATYLVSLVDAHCFPGERDDNIWNLIYGTLSALNRNPESHQSLLRQFENKFISYLGYGEAGDMAILGERVARPF